MFLQPIDIFVYAWLIVAVLSAAYVAWDQFRGNPEPAVMKWGFVLITLYMGPVGLLLYVMVDKEPRPGEHEEFIEPLWKQGVGSIVHCVAGDATGIIIAAVAVAVIGLPMWADLIIEYSAGFLLGLLIFQALFMRKTMGGSYVENVRRSFLPELISMNCMMAGMAPVMVYLMMGRDMRAMWPGEPLFWMVMSLGIVVGFAIAYPVNVWMVSRGMKHGLMTVRGKAASAAKPGSNVLPAGKERASSVSSGDMAGMDHGAMQMAVPADACGKRSAAPTHPQNKKTAAAKHKTRAMSSSKSGAMPGMQADVTRPQLVTVAVFTLLMLIAGMTLPAAFFNLRLSAHDVRGAIMPPGMIMTQETPAETMRDMAGVDPRLVTFTAPADARGDRLAEYKLVDGVKEFAFDASVIRWNILPDRQVLAYAINGQVPGPRIDVEQGDRLRIVVTNHLPEPTTLHWHGMVLPNEMDGAGEITQQPILPGGRYAYEFIAGQTGTYFYHSHVHSDRQQSLGVYGALIVRPTRALENIARARASTVYASVPGSAIADSAAEPRTDHEYIIQLQEWLNRDGLTYPAMNMEGGLPNYFTINGKAFPATDTVQMRVGETIRIRFIGTNTNFVHPMHIHGGPFQVIARDGETIAPSARFYADTVNVGPGQRYDVIWTARKPGRWMIHCHIPHHTTNNNQEQQGGGGLMMVLDVRDASGLPLPMPPQ